MIEHVKWWWVFSKMHYEMFIFYWLIGLLNVVLFGTVNCNSVLLFLFYICKEEFCQCWQIKWLYFNNAQLFTVVSFLRNKMYSQVVVTSCSSLFTNKVSLL